MWKFWEHVEGISDIGLGFSMAALQNFVFGVPG